MDLHLNESQDSLVSLVLKRGRAEIRKQELHSVIKKKCTARWWFQTQFFEKISHTVGLLYDQFNLYLEDTAFFQIDFPRLFPSPGYSGFELLGKKFCILYALCEQQLSKQRRSRCANIDAFCQYLTF